MDNIFAERLKQALATRDMRQTDLVEKTLISKSAISQYLSGAFEPKQKNIYKIAQALNVNPAWLMGKDVNMDETIGRVVNKDFFVAESNAQYQIGKPRCLIPVLGKVQAGIPLEAVENIIDHEEISEEMARCGEFFGLQVKGNSMEPRFIEGDVVIVKKQPDVESGEVGIVLVDGVDATIKRIVKHDNGMSLIALNSTYPPKFYTHEEIAELPVEILGKVVELRGKF